MTDKERRITELVDKLDALTLEANVVTHQLRELRRPEEIQEPSHGPQRRTAALRKNTNDHDFQSGDKAIITNGYRGKRGVEGVVTSTTKTQVTLKDGSGKLYTRKHTNVNRID